MNPDATGSKLVSVKALQNNDVLIQLDVGFNNVGFTTEIKRFVEKLCDVRTPKKSLFRSVTSILSLLRKR